MARARKKKLTPRIPRAEQNRRTEAAAQREQMTQAQLAKAGPRYAILDRSKPVQTISPPADGAHYAQMCSDGITRYYDGSFRRVMTRWDTAAPPAPKTAGLAGKTAARAKVDQPQPTPDDPDDIPEDERELDQAPVPPELPPGGTVTPIVADGEVNLTAWAEDATVNYPYAEVRKAIQERYSKVITTEREALAFLVDEKVAEPTAVDAKWGA